MRTRTLSFLFLIAWPMPLLAQAPSAIAAPHFDANVVGLHDDDAGVPLGLGANYQARFYGDRFEFKPVLGAMAPHDLPLTLRATHLGRGGLAPVGNARRDRHDLSIHYVRPEFVERLEVRSEGLKQSFVFATLPAGDGDLVVRAELTTELRPTPTADGGIDFTLPGIGGVHIEPVLGIDARGATCRGTLRQVDGGIEFVLPRAFVDRAALPLVVDPLLAPIVVVSAHANDERQVDAARLGAPVGMTAITYRRQISGANTDIYVSYVNDAGVLTSTVVAESTTVSGDSPRIAAVPASGKWFVVWNESGNVGGRQLVPNGTSGSLLLAATANTEGQATVSGGERGGATNVCVAWLDSTNDQIRGCLVDTAAAAPAASVSATILTDAGTLTQLGAPSLPSTSASTELLLVYQSESSITGATSVRGAKLDSSVAPSLAAATFAIAGGATSALSPVVAGDGADWTVAYRTNNTLTGAGAACVGVHHHGAAVLTTPRSLVPLGTSVGQIDIAWAGDSAWLAFSRGSGVNHDVVLLSIDPLNCANCEGELLADAGGNDASVAVTALDDGLGSITYVPIAASVGNVSLQRFSSSDGTVTIAGAGTVGAHTVAKCVRAGRADFGIEMHGAPAGVPAFALAASTRIDYACGGGTLVPDLFGGFLLAVGNTSAVGDVRLQIPLPPGVPANVTLFVQMAVPGPGCLGVVDISNALQIQFQ